MSTTTVPSALLTPETWVTPIVAAGDFTAGGSQTWTVDVPSDVVVYNYRKVGKTLHFNWCIATSSVGGTPHAQLKMKGLDVTDEVVHGRS